ncbi:uncharacterized protein LOC143546911 [Bidens hawaiensis]|uniref:uncharacterized protein LOC143546911 n=1 Tax=Bidens hawaiensis TaxID=980011 RepID=UPI00404AD1F6
MAIIPQAVHDYLFSRVVAANTEKETWDILKMEFQGDSQVKAVKLQGLQREFENLLMKEEESIGEYFGRVMAIVSQKRAFGETVSDQTIVEKILRSFTPKFDYIVPSIEVSFDLSKLTHVKLMGSLHSQEERINSRTLEKKDKNEEQALQDYQDTNRLRQGNGSGSGRGRGRALFRGRGRKDCWVNEEAQANVAADNEEPEDVKTNYEQRLFMAYTIDEKATPFSLMARTKENSKSSCLWFIDSGCSNHMTGAKKSFTTLEESFKLVVHLGDKKELPIEGKGTVKITTANGNFCLLDDVYFAPRLEFNLLSVGQLMKKGYSLLFDDNKCLIKNKTTNSTLMTVMVASNNMFLLDASKVTTTDMSRINIVVDETTRLWHMRYGHYHYLGLKQLHDKGMVHGLPSIKPLDS